MDLKHLPSIVDDKNKEDDPLMVDEKFESESESYEEMPKEIHHPSHSNHPLYLKDDFSYDACSLCGYFLNSRSYRCLKSECKFKLHLECASVMPSIKHEEHNHLLALIENSREARACENCRFDLNSFYARCFQCDIDYHVQCDQQGLPGTTIYEFHKHPLFLSYNIDYDKVCDACNKELRPNQDPRLHSYAKLCLRIYSCKECDYSCHVRCVISEIKLDKREKLDYSIHEHVLFLCDENDKDKASCFVCGNFVCAADETSFIYGCGSCSFYIHKSCIPVLEIAHEFHPHHPLKLYWKDGFICDVCFMKISGFTYHCFECDFDIGLECVSKVPSIQHEEHNHLLALIDGSIKKRTCQNCRYVLDSFSARCFTCNIDYHVQCGRQGLPGTTIYEFHNHPLILTYNKDEGKVCDVCGKELNPNPDRRLHDYGEEWPMYNCKECDYSCHVRCVISEIKLDKREKLDHAIHEHVLFSCENDDKDEASCHVCGDFVCAANETTSTYGCSPCSFYAHKSCLDQLPCVEIAHEFHPDHPLTLSLDKDDFSCDACRKIISGLSYRCVECDFKIELNCASKEPSIHDDRHHHLLTFFNKMYGNEKCIDKCGFYSRDTGFLRCVQCDFNVHLLCSPLPGVIKFKGHWHSLGLEDYHIEDDFGEYYCDHCEGPRDPKECAYRCAEGCPYVAEFSCVIDEVVRSLTEKQGDVEVRRVDRNAANEYYYKIVTKGLYLRDVYKSSKEEELELEGLKTTISQMEFQPFMDNEYLRFGFSLFKSNEIKRARKKWWYSALLTVDLKSEVVKIGSYIITKDLETVFSKIHDKYSDIGANCSLSEGSKTFVLIIFVKVIDEMIKTRIVKIKEKVYLSWLFRLLFVRQAGFSIDFVLKHTNKVGAARFDIKKDLDSFPELEDYFDEIKDLTKNIDVQKAKLISLKTEEKKRTNLEFEGSWKEARLQVLSKIDFALERADKGLF